MMCFVSINSDHVISEQKPCASLVSRQWE
jgi:hypothetical protein